MSRRIVACPTPKEHCTGGKRLTNASMRDKGVRYHQTHGQAYKCYRRYLVRILGFEDMGNREFRPPDGGPRVMLTKKSRFGASMRLGKEGARWQPPGSRGGTIISN